MLKLQRMKRTITGGDALAISERFALSSSRNGSPLGNECTGTKPGKLHKALYVPYVMPNKHFVILAHKKDYQSPPSAPPPDFFHNAGIYLPYAAKL